MTLDPRVILNTQTLLINTLGVAGDVSHKALL